MKKPRIAILSTNSADCQCITEAALSLGFRVTVTSEVSELLSVLEKETPLLLFCDSVPANGGGTLRTIANAWDRSASIVLVVPPDIKPGHLKALKPWVHDYLTTPVLREAAAVRMRHALQAKTLEQAAGKAEKTLRGWVAGWESAISSYDPATGDRAVMVRDLARMILRQDAGDLDRPACLMLARANGMNGLDCEVFTASQAKEANGPVRITLPEMALFLRMKAESRLFHANYFDRGGTFRDFQSLFPPELLRLSGEVHNLAGLAVDGGYVVALNFGRPACAEDVLRLKGHTLPRILLETTSRSLHNLSDAFLVTIRALAIAADSQGDNGAHIGRMNRYAETLAQGMSMPDRFVRDLSYSAQLHDVGKMFMPSGLLEKPFRLTSDEYDIIRQHPALGAGVLEGSGVLRVARTIALTHHECWDGSGYPAGLAGNAIPIEGAISKVADVYDALRTPRAYRPAFSHDDARRIILDGDGDAGGTQPNHFNPEVLRVFRNNADRFDEICDRAGLSAPVQVQ